MTSARIAQLLEISERRLVAMESSVSRLERRMDEHEERIEDLEEIFADIKLAAADQAAEEEVEFEARVAGVKKKTKTK